MLLGRCHKDYWGLLDSRQLSVLSKKFREYVYTESNSLVQWIKETFGVEYPLYDEFFKEPGHTPLEHPCP